MVREIQTISKDDIQQLKASDLIAKPSAWSFSDKVKPLPEFEGKGPQEASSNVLVEQTGDGKEWRVYVKKDVDKKHNSEGFKWEFESSHHDEVTATKHAMKL